MARTVSQRRAGVKRVTVPPPSGVRATPGLRALRAVSDDGYAHVPLADAAQALGLAVKTLHNRLSLGTAPKGLGAFKVAGRWRVPVARLRALLTSTHRRGNGHV